MSHHHLVSLPYHEKSHTIKGVFSLSGISILLLLWHLVSNSLPNFLLPSPISTFQKTYETFFSLDFWHNASLTLTRAFIAVCVSFLLSNLMAIACTISVNIKRSLWPLIMLGLTVPSIVVAFISVLF